MIDYKTIIQQLTAFGITNKLEQAHFLAQADHESGGFTKLSEGTKQRFGRAKAIWPTRKSVIQAKQDEFYTSLRDIQLELEHYKDHFKGKVVYCNCDDPNISNFFKYFYINFDRLK